jgi:hypothetical protein
MPFSWYSRMPTVLRKSSATWATLATKTAFDAPQIALHSVTSSPSRLSYRDQEYLDGLIKPLQLVDLKAVTQTGSNDRPLPVLGQQRSLVCCHYRQSSSPQPAPALATLESFQGASAFDRAS